MELKKYRRIAGLTQQQLAKKSGVHKSLISRLESGDRRTASYESIVRLARAMNLDPEQLMPVPKTPPPSDAVETSGEDRRETEREQRAADRRRSERRAS